MKRLAASFILALLAVSPATAASPVLNGKYKARVTSGALHGSLRGTWTLAFKSSDTVDARFNGKSVGTDKFTVKGDVIVFKPAANCSTSGKYTFKLSGTKLKFKRKKDSCIARRTVFSYRFTLVGPAHH